MRLNEEFAAKTVTVVDDEPAMREVLVQVLRSWQYPCQAAASAEQALELLATNPTPIVVTDLRMPGNGGIWLVREIQRRWPRTGIIVLTAGSDSEAARECLNAGADRYFLKPIDPEEFRRALETTLHIYWRGRQRQRYRRQLERTVRRQTRRIRRTFLSAIDSLVRTLEARDRYTSGHSLRVRRYALLLADSLGLDDQQRGRLSLAAKLHDIGKVGIPEDILNKPARLTSEEYRVVREHPLIAERILSPIIRNRSVLAAIRGHHERPDGAGYPDGLQGPHVPLLARIIAITDCYDALTSKRAYREALTVPQALEVLRAGAGTQFDPELVRMFMSAAAQDVGQDRCEV
jgi:response regulator RpfG family c-di-GMP phosphodiesterase